MLDSGWKQWVSTLIEVLKTLEGWTTDDRDVFRPGWVRVSFAGRTRVAKKENVQMVIEELHDLAIADMGASAVQRLPGPRIENGGIPLPGREAILTCHFEAGVRSSVHDLGRCLRRSVDENAIALQVQELRRSARGRRTAWPGAGEANLNRRVTQQVAQRDGSKKKADLLERDLRAFRAACEALDELLAAPRLDEAAVGRALCKLRRSIGRKAGAHANRSPEPISAALLAGDAINMLLKQNSLEDVASQLGLTMRVLLGLPGVQQALNEREHVVMRGVMDGGTPTRIAGDASKMAPVRKSPKRS